MEQTFEDYLISKFAEEEPESMTSKDNWQDLFDKWMEFQGAAMLIQYAERWGTKTYFNGYKKGNKETHENYMSMVKNK